MSETEYAQALAIARADSQSQDYEVESVKAETYEGRPAYEVHFKDGFVLGVRDEFGAARPPEKGDWLRCYGRGFGFEVRGVGLVTRKPVGDGFFVRESLISLYRYKTEKEAELEHARAVAEQKLKRAEEWETKKDVHAADVAALPAVFRERFEFFMRTPSWGPEFGPYEIFVMKEAVKIANTLKTPEAIESFARASWEEQKRLVDLSDDHSGNTFGSACRLAHVFLKEPALVPQMHGALCPLVGCEGYGCWASTDEAKTQREGPKL